jgi:4-aminobutyrate aminotransferase-like enzyme
MTESLTDRRARLLGPNVPTFYERPLHLVRGERVTLWDADGRPYLDCYNNVPHVGHCHHRVVQAIARQAATLNTHTRYLHDLVLDYAERLTARFRHGLSTALFVNSGSEANDVALRMAQAVTGRTGLIATDNTYHGNTSAVSQLSARRPPIGGRAGHVRLIPAPDGLNPVGGSRAGQAEAFARHLSRAIVELEDQGFGFAALVLDPILANEGMPALDPGFFGPALGVVRRARGLVIADEVQPGFGRTGEHWWGHEAMGFVPDIVTLGKPMANGHPVGAVVTRPDVMAAFREAFGFFSTFGGNPVSMAACLATLDVIETEKLVENARKVGAHLLKLLRKLDHPAIAQVRGRGLFFAVEFQGDDPGAFTRRVVEGMKDRGVLVGRVGRQGQVLKLRPPMPFSRADAEVAAAALEGVLREMPA